MTPAPSSSTSGPACCSRWHWSRGWAQLRWVVGEVTPAASPVLVRFVHQKTALVTTYRQDGRPVSTPVSLAVDGDHAYLRSFEQAGKTRRLHHNPRVDVAPSTARDQPTDPTLQATARRLEDVEAQRAARLLARKHPVLHGLLVPLSHRLGRAKAGKTRRLRHNPRVDIAPSTARGRPTGPGIQATARRLEGAEARRAARLLAGKHPLLHGLLVPLSHRLGRAKTDKTVHFQLTPLDPGQAR